MLSAVASLTRGPVELAVGIAFDRRFRLFAINRRGLVFDTRFAPAVPGSTEGVIVYLLLEGELRWSDGQALVGPALFLMRERDFEGDAGGRAGGRTFRSWGEPYRTPGAPSTSSAVFRFSPLPCRAGARRAQGEALFGRG